MADLNLFVCSGRLTRDAEQKTLPSGTQLVTFDIANNTGWGDNEKVLFMQVNLWGKTGQNLFKYLTKGKAVQVYGTLEVQKWVSKHDGSNQQKNVLQCNNVIFIHSSFRDHESNETYKLGDAANIEDAEVEVVF